MTARKNGFIFCFCLVSFVVLNGCATTSSQSFMMSFLPPAPRQAISVAAIEPPVVASNPYIAEAPSFIRPTLAVPPSEAEQRVARAENRFEAGRRLYQSGNIAGARVEFDRALDVLLSAPADLRDRLKIEVKLEQLVATIHRYDVNGMGAGDLSGQIGFDKAPLEDILEMTFPVDPSLKPKVKEQLQATVSQLPLELNDAVLSYINFFSGDRGRRTLLAGLRRAGRYKPLISRILAEEGVPQELIYLAQAESGFLPRAVSHKAAVGMWQFIQSRGREYGLMQTGYTDDRLDPEKATRSAARHLRDLYGKFGDWYLAIAGYNCGDGCIERAVQRTGYADFWYLRERNAIPRETTNYVPIILAMTIMHKNAKDYGLEDIELDAPLTYESIVTDSTTHLALVADAAGRPVSELKELNPALLGNVAPSGYSLRVPAGTKLQVLAGLEAIPPVHRAAWRIHRVSAGDTLESIAKQYRMPVRSIAELNDSSEGELGDVLVIPTSTQLERAKQSPKVSATGKQPEKKAASGKIRRSSHLTKSFAPKTNSRRAKAPLGRVASARMR